MALFIAEDTDSTFVVRPGENTLQAAASAIAAATSAEDAALSAATAEAASGPTYASTAAGLAATTSGQAFAVDAGGGLVSVYLNSSGTAVLQRTLATTGALAASGGSALVGFLQSGTGAVSRTVQDKLRERLSAYDKSGADGSNTTDSTSAINTAIAEVGNRDAIDLAGGTFKVTNSLSNPLGRRFVGGALVRDDVHGGQVQVNSYGDDGKVFIGKEYLYRLFLRIRAGGTLKGFIYGDSTAATTANGGGYAGANFEPQALLPEYLVRAKGIRNNMSFTNRAVGGTKVSAMNAIPDIDTVGGTTDLFIIKYGINDAADGLAGFASNLRSKLAAIRSSSGYGSVDNLSIVLVGPNSTYDPGHGRSSTWYELLRNIYVQAARDYKCAYFDTYAYLRDVDWAATAAGGQMMDDPFTDGQSVHPREIMQTMIWGALVDHMIGDTELTPYVSDQWVALSMLNGWANYGAPFAPASASLSRDGWVTLRGLIAGGTVASGQAVAQVPSYMAPYVIEMFEVPTSSGRCALRINTSGNIEQQDGSASASYTSLSGIRFKVRG